MPDRETFLVELYVLVDEFCKTDPSPASRPGPAPSLWPSEVLTLAICRQWARFRSERDFYRFADRHLRPCFRPLPSRPQLNRLLRPHQAPLTRFTRWLATRLGAGSAPYEVLDGTAVPTRNAKRRGRGWLAGLADIGKCLRRGWIHGLRLLVGSPPDGPVTGWGVGPASTNDRALAETLFTQRALPTPALASVGTPASGVYVADTGFAGTDCEQRWVREAHAQVVAPPQDSATWAWSVRDRRWLAGLRQVVESVITRLQASFRLDTERPHTLEGFQTRLAAKLALHNVCIWLNRQCGQPDLALAHLPGW
jgi:hypothetical protein